MPVVYADAHRVFLQEINLICCNSDRIFLNNKQKTNRKNGSVRIAPTIAGHKFKLVPDVGLNEF